MMFVAVKFYNFTALTILQLCHLQVSEKSYNIENEEVPAKWFKKDHFDF